MSLCDGDGKFRFLQCSRSVADTMRYWLGNPPLHEAQGSFIVLEVSDCGESGYQKSEPDHIEYCADREYPLPLRRLLRAT